ncbi:hypothetical protein Tco_0024089 [Tanacetum coccineum]
MLSSWKFDRFFVLVGFTASVVLSKECQFFFKSLTTRACSGSLSSSERTRLRRNWFWAISLPLCLKRISLTSFKTALRTVINRLVDNEYFAYFLSLLDNRHKSDHSGEVVERNEHSLAIVETLQRRSFLNVNFGSLLSVGIVSASSCAANGRMSLLLQRAAMIRLGIYGPSQDALASDIHIHLVSRYQKKTQNATENIFLVQASWTIFEQLHRNYCASWLSVRMVLTGSRQDE